MKYRLNAFAAAVIALATHAACGDAAPAATAAEPVVRDSAGITIVENHAPHWGDGEGWRISAEPVLEIGMIDGPEAYQFQQIRGAVVLADGTIVVGDGGTREVRLFDSTGRNLRTTGGQGAGPGEFRAMTSLHPYLGDSIAVWDGVARRLTIVGSDGGLARTVSLPGVAGFGPQVHGLLSDGSILLVPGETAELYDGRSGIQRDTATVLLISPDGEAIDTIGRVPREEVEIRPGSPPNIRPVLLARAGSVAALPDGVVVTGGDAPEVTFRWVDGSRRIARFDGLDRIVTESVLRRARTAEFRRLEDVERWAARHMPRAPRPVTLPDDLRHALSVPEFSALHTSPRGRVFAQRYRIDPDDDHVWQVLDPDGRWLGGLSVPKDVTVLSITDDVQIGLYRDDFDVEYVRMYRLERR